MADLGSVLGSVGIGGAIGKAIVSLELDTKKYAAELKGAQASTVSSTNAMASSTSKFAGLASAAFKAAAVGAVAFAAYSVKAAIEANDAQLKLQNTFENNARLSDSSVEAFTQQADALRALTGVDDEAIISGQALLGSFKLTGEEVMQLTPLVVDLSEKYNIDLQSAFKAVGKASQGNAASLSKFGITLDENALSADAYGTVLKGLGVAQGFAADSAKAEPWRVLQSTFEEIAEQLGQQLLPILQDLAKLAQNQLLPVLKVVADNAGTLLTVFIAYKGLQFLPALLFNIGLGLEAIGAASLASGIANVAGSIAGLGSGIIALAAIDIAGLAYLINKIATGEAPTFAEDLGHGLAGIAVEIPGLKEKLDSLPPSLKDVAEQEERAAERAQRFGHMSKKAFGEFKQDVVESVQVTAGEFEKLNDAFSTTPQELQKQMALAVQIARREHRTLREIFSDKSLTDGQKEALASLPADQRDAWARAGEAGKTQIENDAVKLKRLNTQNFREITNAAKGPAKEGMVGVGRGMMEGAANGVTANEILLSNAIHSAVAKAIQEGKDTAGSASPSKVMHELGLDMMEGLYQGITKGAQKVIDATEKSIQKLIDKTSSQLDKVKGLAQSFADSIKSGFSGFSDIAGAFGSAEPGTPLSDVLTSQLTGAAQLADVLRTLKIQGASQATLAQVAGAGAGFGQTLLQGGPELVGEMNAALEAISGFSSDTGEALSKTFFGDRIDKLGDKLDRQNDKMQELIDIEKLGHSHAIILDGVKVTEAIRNELIKTGKRNDGAGIP